MRNLALGFIWTVVTGLEASDIGCTGRVGNALCEFYPNKIIWSDNVRYINFSQKKKTECGDQLKSAPSRLMLQKIVRWYGN